MNESVYITPPTGVFLRSASDSSTTYPGGIQAAYLYEFTSHWVLGGSASIDRGSDSSSTSSNGAGANVSSSRSSSEIGGEVVGKVGCSFGDFLPYVDGGWAWSN